MIRKYNLEKNTIYKWNKNHTVAKNSYNKITQDLYGERLEKIIEDLKEI